MATRRFRYMKELILASNSPRRRALLAEAGISFRQIPSGVEERADPALSPERLVESLARQKAEDVYARFGGIVLGADTVVCLNGAVLGKPRSREHAQEMLRALSGKKHTVWSGYCLLGAGAPVSGAVSSEVEFRMLSEEEIGAYVASGSPMDKAGAYGVQDENTPVRQIVGSYTNVMGLPMERIAEILKEKGLWV